MITIVPASEKHIPILAALARQTFLETFTHYTEQENVEEHLARSCSPEFFQRSLVHEKDDILIAYSGKTPIGYAKAGNTGLPVVMPNGSQELHRLYVIDAFHGKGIGKALMERVLSLPRLQEAERIYIGVWEHNHKAQRFYAHYGFVKFSEYHYPVGNEIDRELILASTNERLMNNQDTTNPRIKRLVYRSCNRGCKETDLLLGRFASHELAGLSDPELDEYERLIEESDADIFAWLTGKLPTPPEYVGGVIEKIKG